MSNLNWIEKLKIEVIDEEDGTCTIRIEWDDADPDLAEWTSWGEEKQSEFVLDSLRQACANALDEDLTESVD